MLPTILFYIFSSLMVFSAVAVVASKSSVHSVLFLIFSFFNAAGLFLLLGAEFLAMLIVIVYVGAVAVLFLFVVMMLNIKTSEIKDLSVKYLTVGIAIAVTIFIELCAVLNISAPLVIAKETRGDGDILTNTEAIGMVLYTDYGYLFQISGLILLVAMIGAIVLTHRTRTGVRKQNISEQLVRDPQETVQLVQVEVGKGLGD